MKKGHSVEGAFTITGKITRRLDHETGRRANNWEGVMAKVDPEMWYPLDGTWHKSVASRMSALHLKAAVLNRQTK